LSDPVRVLARALASVAILVGLGAVTATGARASAPPRVELWVEGGAGWHSNESFLVTWKPAPGEHVTAPIAAVHYRLARDGIVVVADRRVAVSEAGVANGVGFTIISVPPVPGRYETEVWLEDSAHSYGLATSTVLQFDYLPPAAVRPLLPNGWVGANASPLLRLEHPAAPLPAAGIRGYAISVDGAPGGSPCAGPDSCEEDETDLAAGMDDDSLSLGVLPEGTSFVHVVAVSGAGIRSAQVGTASIHVDRTPPRVALSGLPGGWVDGPVRLTATATDSASGMAAAGLNGPLTEIGVDGARPSSAAGPSSSALVAGSGVHQVLARARDGAGNLGTAPPATVRIDEEGPRVAFLDTQDGAEPERLEATVSDPLSRPDPRRGSIAVRPLGSGRQFLPLATTVAAGRLVARWDSDAYPPGSYEFRASGYDTAGNSAGSERRANGTRMVLANPLKKPTAIVAWFGAKRRTARSARFGHGAPVSGRLTSATGSPLGGLPVQLVESFDTGSKPERRTTTVETAADGTFLAHLAPGPSREVEAVFAGSRTLGRATAPALRLEILSGVRMRASATMAKVGGAPVVFSGRVAGAGAGIPVELQFRLRRGDWREFRTVKTGAHGRFRYPYAFSDDDSRGVRFQFRAFVAVTDGWPYEPAGSRPVFVTGR